MALIGYARVSTDDQQLDMQLAALDKAGVTRIYKDQGVSGSKLSRPEFDKCLDRLESGDTLVVYSLSRVGRTGPKTAQLVMDLEGRGVHFRSLTEGIETVTPMGRCMLQVIAAFAALEREMLIERTNAGLAVAREKGHLGGRPKALDTQAVTKVTQLRGSGLAPADIAKVMGVSRATVYRVLAAAE